MISDFWGYNLEYPLAPKEPYTGIPEPGIAPVEGEIEAAKKQFEVPVGQLTPEQTQAQGNPAFAQLTPEQKGTTPIYRDVSQMTPEQQGILEGRIPVTEANKQMALDAGVPQSVVDRAISYGGSNIKNAGWAPGYFGTSGLTSAEYKTQGRTQWGPNVPIVPSPSVSPTGERPPYGETPQGGGGGGIAKPTTIEPTLVSQTNWDNYFAQEIAGKETEKAQAIASSESAYAVKGAAVGRIATGGRTSWGGMNKAAISKQFDVDIDVLKQEQKLINAQLLPWFKPGSANVQMPTTAKRNYDFATGDIYANFGIPKPIPKEMGGTGDEIRPVWLQHNVPNALWFEDGTLVKAKDPIEFRDLLTRISQNGYLSLFGDYEDPITPQPYEVLQDLEKKSFFATSKFEDFLAFSNELLDQQRAGNITVAQYDALITGSRTLFQIYNESSGRLGSLLKGQLTVRDISVSDFLTEQGLLAKSRFADNELKGHLKDIYTVRNELLRRIWEERMAGGIGSPFPDDWENQDFSPTNKYPNFNPKLTMDRIKELSKQLEGDLNKVAPPISGWSYKVEVTSPNDGDVVMPVLITGHGWQVSGQKATYINPSGQVFSMAEMMTNDTALKDYAKGIPEKDIKAAADYLANADAQQALQTIQSVGNTPEMKIVLWDIPMSNEDIDQIFPNKWWMQKRIPFTPAMKPTPIDEKARFAQYLKSANLTDMPTMDKIKGIMAFLTGGGGIGAQVAASDLGRILTGVTDEGKSVGEAVLNPMEFEVFNDLYSKKIDAYKKGNYLSLDPFGLLPEGKTRPWTLGAAGVAGFLADPNWLWSFGMSEAGSKVLPYVIKSSQYGLEKAAIKEALITGELGGIKLSEKEAGTVIERAATMIGKNPEASAKWADVIATKGFNAPEAKGLLKEIAESKVTKGAETVAAKAEQVAAKTVQVATPEIAVEKTATAVKPTATEAVSSTGEKAVAGEVAPKVGEVGVTVPPKSPIQIKREATRTTVQDAWNSLKEVGVVADPKEQAAKQVRLFNALVDLAKVEIEAGVKTIEEFARVAGVEINAAVKAAWKIAHKGGTVKFESLSDAVKNSISKVKIIKKRQFNEAEGIAVDNLKRTAAKFDGIWNTVTAERQAQLSKKATALETAQELQGAERIAAENKARSGLLTDIGLTEKEMFITEADAKVLEDMFYASPELDVWEKANAARAMRLLAQDWRIPRPFEREYFKKVLGYDVVGLFEQSSKSRLGDYITELLYNSFISPKSNVVNFGGNAIATLLSPVERGLAATAERGLAKAGRRAPQRFFGEVAQDVVGAWTGIPDGVRSWLEVMKSGQITDSALKGEVVRPRAFKGKLGRVINVNTDLMYAFDELFKSINRSAALRAQSYRQAMTEGFKGEAFRERLNVLINDPPEELINAANKVSEYRLFRAQSNLADTLMKARDFEVVGGVKPIQFAFPFIKTPVNLSKFGIERSPVAILNPKLYRNVAAKNPEAADQLARWAMGSLVALAVTIYAKDGLITGAAPKGVAEGDEFYRLGKQPYSLKLGNKWVSYQRLEPFNQMFLQASVIVGALKEKDISKFAGDLTFGIAQNITNQNFLTGLSDSLNAITEPERYAKDYFQRMASSLMPFSSTSRLVAQTIDTTIRQPQGLKETVEANIPGVSRNVPAKLNIFGEPQKRETPAISPYAWSTEKTDHVTKVLEAAGVRPGFVGDSITEGGQTYKLTEQEHYDYQVSAGEILRRKLDAVIGNRTTVSTATLESVVDAARTEARTKQITEFRKAGRKPD